MPPFQRAGEWAYQLHQQLWRYGSGMSEIITVTSKAEFAQARRLLGAYQRSTEPLAEAAGVCA